MTKTGLAGGMEKDPRELSRGKQTNERSAAAEQRHTIRNALVQCPYFRVSAMTPIAPISATAM
jgi:hypothetical protein